MTEGEPLRWWQTRRFVVLATLIAIVPLLWPTIPPLVDLPGHMGRYRVQLAIGDNPWLTDWYDFSWSLIGNLGIDLLIVPLAPVFGLELAVKLIVMAIPATITAGLLWIAREVHGRVPATALFALPLAYSFPVQFGFVNFALSIGIALVLFALWLRLARQDRIALRAIVFVPLSCLLWLCHTFGWGVLGVLAFSAEMIRQHDRRLARDGVSVPALPSGATLRDQLARTVRRIRRGHWIESWLRAGLGCLPLALPMVLMIFWRSGDHVTGVTADWFNWHAKAQWVTMILRDRWLAFDIAATAILFLILLKGVRDPAIEYSRHLGLSATFLAVVFILLPRIVFGSAYADMRLAPYVIAVAVIALRPRRGVSARNAATLAAAGLAFFLIRTGGTTISYWLFDRSYKRELAALDRLPDRARLVSFVGTTCSNRWLMTRLEHLPAIALERKLAYSNDQWSMPGAQLLTTRYDEAGGFAHDPSELVTERRCRGEFWRTVNGALLTFPRDAFNYVWLIKPPEVDPRLLRGLIPVWRGTEGSALYRIDHRVPAPLHDPATMPRPRY